MRAVRGPALPALSRAAGSGGRGTGSRSRWQAGGWWAGGGDRSVLLTQFGPVPAAESISPTVCSPQRVSAMPCRAVATVSCRREIGAAGLT